MTMDEAAVALEAVDIFPDSARVNGDRLVVGGCDLVTLASQYGTPLYVFDEETIRSRARDFRSALTAGYPGVSSVCYAAKAYCAPWLLRVIAEEGLGLDVVSGGELYTALMVDFPRDRIYFHGNNKSEDELELALANRVGRIVLDNLEEIHLLGKLAAARGMHQPVLLRVGPGIETRAHAHLRTGGADSKFGLSIATGQAAEGVRKVLAQPALDLRGLHTHIGSQVSDVDAYRTAVHRLLGFSEAMRQEYQIDLREVSPGGGYAVRYTPDAAPVIARDMIRQVGQILAAGARDFGMADLLPQVTIEPGRSLVAAAAVALYRVGSVKCIPGGRTYVSVDGGMADNMRPAAYGAEYTALLANRVSETSTAEVAIAGKYCESGDVLIPRVHLPLPRSGDLVAIPSAGAYQLSMANNYNMALRPAVVVVAGGRSRLVRRRETYADLLTRDLATTYGRMSPEAHSVSTGE